LSDDWDFYFARVHDAVSSIFVDLGIRADVPMEKRPWLLWVWVTLQAPKPDGLATNEEARTLHEIGEALNSMVSAVCGAQLVARITGAGRREFYFYGAEPGELRQPRRTPCKRIRPINTRPAVRSNPIGTIRDAVPFRNESRTHAEPSHARVAGGAGRPA
jgi:hypothetical protein